MGVGQYDLLKNVQPTDNTVLNTLTVNKLTTLNDEQYEGDIVSYEFVVTITQEKLQTLVDYAIPAFSLPAEAELTVAQGDVDIYKIVYLAREARATDSLVQMSGTLCIPKNITKTYIEVYGHGNIYSYVTSTTLRTIAYNYQNNVGDVDPEFVCKTGGIEGFGPLVFGQVVMVQADDIGYGVTRGRSPGLDKETNVYSYTGALIATKNLMKLNPNGIFDKFIAIKNPSETVDVVIAGFSQGANNVIPLSAYVMENIEQFGLNVKLTCAEGAVALGPSNFYPVITGCYSPIVSGDYINSFKLLPSTYLSLLLGAPTQTNTSESGMNMTNVYRPNILTDVILKNNSLYVDQEKITSLAQYTVQQSKIALATIQSMLNNLIFTDPTDPTTLVPPYYIGFPAAPGVPPYLQNTIAPYIPSVPGLNFVPVSSSDLARIFVNPLYIYTDAMLDYGYQPLANGCDFTSNINVPTRYVEGVPFVEIYIVSDELIRMYGLPSGTEPVEVVPGLFVYQNPAALITQYPDLSPTYLESFVTGEPIPDSANAFFNKFIPDVSNPGFYVPLTISSQWKRNNNGPTNGTSATPTCLNRASGLYEPHLDYDSANVLDIAADIASAAGTERSIVYQLAELPGYNVLTNPQYGSHTYFGVYTNLCIQYNLLKNLV
jgi:hypothetical protein